MERSIIRALLCIAQAWEWCARRELAPPRKYLLLPSSDRAACILSVYATIAQPGAVSAIRLFKPEKQFRALSRNNIAPVFPILFCRWHSRNAVCGTRSPGRANYRIALCNI